MPHGSDNLPSRRRALQPIRLRVQKLVQRLLHAAPHHLIEVVLMTLFNEHGVVWVMAAPSQISWLRLATSNTARFGATSHTYLCGDPVRHRAFIASVGGASP